MALQKPIQLQGFNAETDEYTDTGITSDYHKVTDISMSTNGAGSATVSQYKDAAARKAGKAPMGSKTYNFSAPDLPFTIDAISKSKANPFSVAYDKLKTLEEFSGSEDV